MKFHRKPESEEDSLEMTPMIDVTFLLLVFFLCTLQFKTLEGRLSAHLPKDEGMAANPEPPREKLHIGIQVLHPGERMDATGTRPYEDPTGKSRVTYRNRQLQYTVGTLEFRDLHRLGAWLRQRKAGSQELPIVLDPSIHTILGDVVPVLDQAVQAGFGEVQFSGAGPR